MQRERYKELFNWDGSILDVYVRPATMSDWQHLLTVLHESSYDIRYIVDGDQVPKVPERIEVIFAQRQESNVALMVDGQNLALMCHFFTPDEIEFDVNPHVIDSQLQLDRLIGFMRAVGGALGKEIILTPENLPNRPLLRFDPQADHEDWPSYSR